MPPKKTSTRLDITLPISLVDRLRAFADQEGTTVSSVIGQAVRAHLDGGVPSPSSGQMTLSPADIDSLISQRVGAALQEHLSKIQIPVPTALAPESSDDQVTEPAPEKVRTPISIKKEKPVPEGKVIVPEDIRKKMTHYSAATIANAIHAIFNPENDPEVKTITRGTLQGFVKGTAKATTPEYLTQITRGIEALESQKRDHADLSVFN